VTLSIDETQRSELNYEVVRQSFSVDPPIFGLGRMVEDVGHDFNKQTLVGHGA
jgi:hypothetical protein